MAAMPPTATLPGNFPVHPITTVQDLVRIVTTENVRRLGKDIVQWLQVVASLKEADPTFSVTGLEWVDDGLETVNVIMTQRTAPVAP
jgi:hypothetical protein